MNKYLISLLFLIFLTGCIGKGSVSVDLTQGNEYSWLHINEPTDEIEFNWHGGGWHHGMNRFKLRIPLKQNSITGSDMYFKTHREESIDIHDSSTVKIMGCKVSIVLFDQTKEPFTFNGVYNLPGWSCKSKT
jgi:hypothetical protein